MRKWRENVLKWKKNICYKWVSWVAVIISTWTNSTITFLKLLFVSIECSKQVFLSLAFFQLMMKNSFPLFKLILDEKLKKKVWRQKTIKFFHFREKITIKIHHNNSCEWISIFILRYYFLFLKHTKKSKKKIPWKMFVKK